MAIQIQIGLQYNSSTVYIGTPIQHVIHTTGRQ